MLTEGLVDVFSPLTSEYVGEHLAVNFNLTTAFCIVLDICPKPFSTANGLVMNCA